MKPKTKAVSIAFTLAMLVLVLFWAVVAGRFVPHSHGARVVHSHDNGATHHAH